MEKFIGIALDIAIMALICASFFWDQPAFKSVTTTVVSPPQILLPD